MSHFFVLLIIGDCVPNGDPHWICYIGFVSILALSTAVEVPPEMIDDLGMVIEKYLSTIISSILTQ